MVSSLIEFLARAQPQGVLLDADVLEVLHLMRDKPTGALHLGVS